MSHVAKVNCIIKDLDALGEAAQKFNAELVRDKKTFKMWGNEKQPCIHAIKLNGDASAYEVGLRYNSATDPDAGFEFACDFYDGKLAKAFGPELVSLRNEYQAVVAENTLRKRGWRVQRMVDTREQVQLTASR